MLDVGPGPGRHVWCAGRWLSESTSSPPSSCKVQGWTYVIVSFELRVFFGKGGHAAMYLWHFVQDHDFWRVVCSQCWSATKDIRRHPDWAGCEWEMKAWGKAHTGQLLWFCINKSTDYFWMAWKQIYVINTSSSKVLPRLRKKGIAPPEDICCKGRQRASNQGGWTTSWAASLVSALRPPILDTIPRHFLRWASVFNRQCILRKASQSQSKSQPSETWFFRNNPLFAEAKEKWRRWVLQSKPCALMAWGQTSFMHS